MYEKLSTELSRPSQITFTKVNTDNNRDITQTYGITAMPTFMIFKNGRETKRIKGADPKALDAAIKSLAAEAASSSSNDASSSSVSSSGTWVGASLPRGYSDITESVDQLNLDFLNVSSDAGAARSVFTTAPPSALSKAKSKEEDSKDWIESDTDEQLMLYIPFQSTLKVHTLHITSIPPADDEEVTRPSSIRLYSNKPNVLSFDEAEDLTATQIVELKPEDWDPKTHTAKVELRFVKFQNITSLVVFVAEAEGDGERTRVDRIRVVGESGEKRSMGKLEKIGDEQGE